ncbi:GTP-binding protein [Rhizobium sp. KAs_5_22]|uniref:elongation factor G n=1 Tax=Ciceribacter selenitireducens TaxID=448181 RepID=UPI0004916A03|nr:TetM/TetW/TetO/TetS family tetracycline resistance ribosomal protection protein [Ciceribacter selenitireducens]PPJ46731.1 GTP-binding protein [Rhizobium sp. KAs_5_22]
MRILNLGILAHVDAGKTSLTERLLFDTGAIAKLGSVDGGNTQTDSLELERQRGITIAAAVVSFRIGDLSVNLIDTPGHPDFIAEVERVLRMLDAAIVVVSAVEGVQAQTRVLVRALQRLCIPFLFFVNKIDRPGARCCELLTEFESKLGIRPLAMSSVRDAGGRHAVVTPVDLTGDPGLSAISEALSANDEALLYDYVLAPDRISGDRLRSALAAQVAGGLLHPAYCGIAMTGEGVTDLIGAIEHLLPSRTPDVAAPLSGNIFKIERGWGGEKIAYLNLTAGSLLERSQIELPGGVCKVTRIQVFDDGALKKQAEARAGQIVKVSGLSFARIGDQFGTVALRPFAPQFAAPTLETRILSGNPSENGELWTALQQLSEQDPLINLRTNADASEMFLSLYGEVQKEVIQATLLRDFGVDAVFEESTVIHAERPIGVGEAIEVIFKEPNPFLATFGLRIEPSSEGSGNTFALEVDVGQMPASFYRAVEAAVSETLKAGLYGWPVIDCHVAVTALKHSSPSSTAVDFRSLTPLVLARALVAADTVVCEPFERFQVEVPLAVLPTLHVLLSKSGGAVRATEIDSGVARLEGVIPSTKVQNIRQQLPGLSSGAGIMETVFDHHAALVGTPPMRRRMSANPFDRSEYLARLR